jgi:methylated-DNA-[protein]-cysteine S-methyltransferase
MTARHARIETELGCMLLVARDDALVGAYFDGQKYLPAPNVIGDEVSLGEDRLLSQAATELLAYLAGERNSFAVPIAPQGDDFSQKVWQILLRVPYGATVTYGAIAEELGGKGLSQRVGQSVGHNPLSVIVPCHRVLGADGSLTGYAGGLDRKRALLALEEPDAANAGRLF